ncbi:MAG: transglycosylase SLT domain-containing protein [Methylococcaceae bacterium]|nr:transglycosylase SLT domain-containing protein [Methylococcaceae bacterium]
MMKKLSILRKPLWLSLLLSSGLIPAMTSPTAANTPEAALIGLFNTQANADIYRASYTSHYLPRPMGLKDAVNFWRQVFGDWRAHQIVLHDDTHLGIIYATVEINGYIGGKLSSEQQIKVDDYKKHLVNQLNDLEYLLHKHAALTPEQQNLYDLITRNAGKEAIQNAAQRVRTQRGMKESFQTGLEASSRYNTQMREVFRANHLPEELAYLPHVESAFTTNARSPAGAVGVWQFMPATGKRFLRIDKSMDERYDPILATQGAAKYLAHAFDKQGDWGLAVTSYNYGLSGMSRARIEHGRDIARIVKEYDGASFGFASRNYYAEFLAVCDIMADLPRYFPKGIDYQQPPQLKRIEITQEMTSGEIAEKHHIHYTTLAELNPAWTKEAAEGRVALPANTLVWLPRFVSKENFMLVNAKKNKTVTTKANLGNYTLTQLNTALPDWDILKAFPNGLSGQLLATAPQQRAAVKTTRLAQAPKPQVPQRLHTKANDVHIVQSGDSPYTIASKYSVHLKELLSLNEMTSGSLIRPGQSIRIPLKING